MVEILGKELVDVDKFGLFTGRKERDTRWLSNAHAAIDFIKYHNHNVKDVNGTRLWVLLLGLGDFNTTIKIGVAIGSRSSSNKSQTIQFSLIFMLKRKLLLLLLAILLSSVQMDGKNVASTRIGIGRATEL
mmetsp:Transcript_27356/g.54814  ORF Transcript_27356/g.54814 Transcript_27356/m.54814 type:complete len:131 (-) Transcript_27356:263-655(-)